MKFSVETLKRFFNQSYSKKDIKNLFLWFNSEKGVAEIEGFLDDKWQRFNYDSELKLNSEKIFLNVIKEIRQRKTISLKQRLMRLTPYAAIFILIIGFTIVLFNFKYTSHDIVTNNACTSFITENGNRSKIILPDSSMVWLNSGTTLSYSNFSGNHREVYLNGQAYFKVAHDENNPFTVQCDELLITVLGTEFDVDAYPGNDKISVVLESGKVKLTHQRYEAFNCILNPGELVDFNKDENKIYITHPEIEKLTSWKDGRLIFKDDPIKNVFDKLERWYNIEIDVIDPDVYNSIFTGTICNESYEQIFRLIEFSCNLKCQLNKGTESQSIPKIIISRK